VVDGSAVVHERIVRDGTNYRLVVVTANDSFLYDFYRRVRVAGDVHLYIKPLRKEHPSEEGTSAIYVDEQDLETLRAIENALSAFLQTLPTETRLALISSSSEPRVRCRPDTCGIYLKRFVLTDERLGTFVEERLLGRPTTRTDVVVWADSPNEARSWFNKQVSHVHDVVDASTGETHGGKHYFGI